MNQTTGTEAALARHYADVRSRLSSGTTPPERARRFVPVRQQSHRPDYVPPAPRVPMVRIDAAVRERVRDILTIAQQHRAEAFDPGHWLEIIDQVCVKHDITRGELLSSRRARPIVAARHEAMYRMSKETSMSLPAIGRRLGDKDHTTVLSGIRRHEERMGLERTR
ncbi:helix-turn-helix domain-containing protein [Devosia sp. SL43]|uniref:helix-turn-helix domain-containing protein n=1 Tax=Devosia sp. SL43 TaxID=2806348 RepID=UPI001F2F0EFA|nr:helix-turn-helix domain-containing protein [Devosia sp. SL43]UJW87909.1 hypothetical protein IM737_20725 [Devosia sp. SL43]